MENKVIWRRKYTDRWGAYVRCGEAPYEATWHLLDILAQEVVATRPIHLMWASCDITYHDENYWQQLADQVTSEIEKEP